MVSRKAAGSVRGFFKLWKICGGLKGEGKEGCQERVKMTDRKEKGCALGPGGCALGPRVTLEKKGHLFLQDSERITAFCCHLHG